MPHKIGLVHATSTREKCNSSKTHRIQLNLRQKKQINRKPKHYKNRNSAEDRLYTPEEKHDSRRPFSEWIDTLLRGIIVRCCNTYFK